MHHIDGLKEWLEDKVRTLTDPPLADLKRPLVISQQLKSGRANMLRIKVPKVFYARSGSHCYPLGVSQINDIWQRQKSPVIQISEFQITGLFPTGSPLPHYSLVVQLHNISKTVCRSHLVRARIPLAIGGTFVEIPDTETYQPKMTGFTRYYLDDEAELAAYVVEFEGSEIYPDHDITKVAKLYPSGRRDLEQFVSRTVRKASVRVFTDPLAEIRGATEIPVLE